MSDQARLLRDLMESHRASSSPVAAPSRGALATSRAFTIAVTGGKGGVGKTCIALNLAVALAREGARVALFDANPGLGGIDLLCGLNGYWNLGHVVSGARRLEDVLLEGPAGLSLLTGASALLALRDETAAACCDVVGQLDRLEQSCDILLVDTGGPGRETRRLSAAADAALVVTTPEATSIAEAYTTIKALAAADDPPRLAVLVNQAESTAQAEAIVERIQQTARLFVHRELESAGSIPHDSSVPRSVSRRTPFALERPASPAAAAIERLARRMVRLADDRTHATCVPPLTKAEPTLVPPLLRGGTRDRPARGGIGDRRTSYAGRIASQPAIRRTRTIADVSDRCEFDAREKKTEWIEAACR